MRRLAIYLPALFSGFLLASTVLVYPAFSEGSESQDQPIELASVDVYPTSEGATAEIRTNAPFSFVTYTLTDPDRLIVDPVESRVYSFLPTETSLDGKLVRDWKIVPLAGEEEGDSVDYLSFDLAGPAEHLVESASDKLVIRIRPKPLNEPAQSAPGPGENLWEYPFPQSPGNLPLLGAMDPLAPAAGTGAGDSGIFWSLEKATGFGLSRHRPIQVAEQEAKLAEMKVREARRALYPAASLRSTWTEGVTSKIGFSEAQHGIQLDHPLYYSGRLTNTYRQALVNLQVAEKRKNKAQADFIMEVVQAYYQYVGAKASLTTQKGLLKECRQILEQTEGRFQKGLLTRLELLNVQAQFNQAKFQLATAENDLMLARFKFLQRLKLNPNAIVEVPSDFPTPTPSNVDLEEALQLAAQYRPDIQINSLLVEFNEYERLIAKEKGDLRVDLSTFFGVSGAAFETENMSLDKDYSVGVKATKNWGPNEASFSTTTTKTSPRLGQTSVTDSTVYSGQLGLLSKLNALSDVQQAIVALEKAQQDLDEAKATVFQEVEEAYVSCSKAHLQLEYAQQKVAFREEQLKITKAQTSLNEALPSQLLEAVMRLTEERVNTSVALTNYYVALARLNKAVGLPNHYH